ncbi:uncharacterized protein LOC117293006 [Asterias rubens]|uniref:uncharacterized protein LOC117293006 n=1 Tax=Asterias rubens TaxID=7604 RepID=UPI0014559F5B|nr:uncharacterized protein LOC117293006 [Asterias rubens]
MDKVFEPRPEMIKEGKTELSTVIEDKEDSAKNESDASKMSLVAELKQKDSFPGKPLRAIPSSKGRYQPIGAEDKSLRPIGADDDDDADSELPREINQEVKDPTGDFTTKEKTTILDLDKATKQYRYPCLFMFKLTQNPETSASASTEQSGAEPNMTADGSVKRDSLVATINVVTNLMKWQLKSKKQAGVKLKSMEKYKGHMEVIQRRSRQEQVELPYPIRLNIRREVLPIIHNIVKDYKLTLGPNHKLTREAMAKEAQLQSELTEGDGVVL